MLFMGDREYRFMLQMDRLGYDVTKRDGGAMRVHVHKGMEGAVEIPEQDVNTGDMDEQARFAPAGMLALMPKDVRDKHGIQPPTTEAP